MSHERLCDPESQRDAVTSECVSNCVICLEAVSSSHTKTLKSCGHVFHESCLNTWLLTTPTCPVCRSSCHECDLPKKYVVVEISTHGRVYWWCGNVLDDDGTAQTITVNWGLPEIRPNMTFVEGQTWCMNTPCDHVALSNSSLSTELFEATMHAHATVTGSVHQINMLPRPTNLPIHTQFDNAAPRFEQALSVES